MKNKNFNFGLAGLIIGVCGLFLLFFAPIVVLPLLVLTIIFSVISIKKDSSVHGKIGLGIGILGIVGLVIIGFVGIDIDLFLPNAQNPNPDEGSIVCEDLSYEQCLEYPDYCGFCGKSVTSSYAGCYAKEFCDNVVDVQLMATQYVEEMSEFSDNNGRNLEVIDIIQAKCVGCYIVELSFLTNSLKNSSLVDRVIVTLTINNWEVSDAVISYESKDSYDEITLPEAVISIEECEKMGGEVYNILEETKYEGFLVGRIEGLNCPCACRIDDYSACKTFFDGCNNCYVNDENGDVACTEMDCENLGEAYCLEFW